MNISDEAKSVLVNKLRGPLQRNDYKEIYNQINKYDTSLRKELTNILLSKGVNIFKGMPQIMNGFLGYSYSDVTVNSITIPSNITKIGDDAFYNVKSLQSVAFEDGVKIIGKGAFYGTNVQKLIFPDSVQEIRDDCFSHCDNLRVVLIPDNVNKLPKVNAVNDNVKIYATSRKDFPNHLKLRCDSESVEFYKKHLILKGEYDSELQENLLTEAWGNVPNWMKAPLNQMTAYADFNKIDKIKNNSVYKAAYDDAIAKGKSPQTAHLNARDAWYTSKGLNKYKPDFQSPRGEHIPTAEKFLLSRLQEEGIDLNDPNLIITDDSNDMPTSSKDSRISGKNIGIWHIPNVIGAGQLYIQGINELEKVDNSSLGKASGKPFKYLSPKGLAEISDKFAWIDGSSIVDNKDNFADKAKTRQEFHKYKNNNPNYERDVNRVSTSFWDPKSGSVRYTVDKSGYYIITPAYKYKDKLKQLRLTSYAKTVDKYESLVKQCKSDYVSVVSDYEISDADNVRIIQNFAKDLQHLIYNYNLIIAQLDDALAMTVKDDIKAEYIQNVITQINVQITDINRYQDELNKYKLTTLDF